MRIALIADTFPPIRTSGATQLRDLSREFVRQGHLVTVLLPTPNQEAAWLLEDFDGVQLLRLKSPQTKDIGYVRRAVCEFAMPITMLRQFSKSPLSDEKWDGVVWYSPSIFHGLLAGSLKKRSNCKGYLIIRDIFPEWAIDMGLIGRGLPYLLFNVVARYQYSVADVIGVQTKGNLSYFEKWQQKPDRKLEVLQNWLDKPATVRCSIPLKKINLAGRRVFIYAGNMGIAQGMDILLDLAEQMLNRTDVGFLFVGRGSDVTRLKVSSINRNLHNIVFWDEIHPDEIPDLYSQCSVGLVALDPRHKSHNIPGKFLTYMQCGLPVLANVNKGNDLAELIRDEQVGQVCESNRVSELIMLADKLLEQIHSNPHEYPNRCRSLFARQFSVDKTVTQIVAALTE